MTDVDAIMIDRLLQERHSQDVYISQCKTGATWGNNHLLIFDGWAMKKKWAKPLVIGYEIKVHRSDFLKDDKWLSYLPYCNQFYFVCPPGIIAPNELPADVGLIITSKPGTKLFEKKKAIYRHVTIPDSIFRYILMSRVKITHDTYVRQNEQEFWREWLKDKEKCKGFGVMVSRSIRIELEERVEKVQEENRKLQNKIKEFEGIKKIIERVGMDSEKIESWSFSREFRVRIEELKRGFPEGFDQQVNSVLQCLGKIKKVICDEPG